MGFFKDFKDDLSETANGLNEAVNDTEQDIMVNTLDEQDEHNEHDELADLAAKLEKEAAAVEEYDKEQQSVVSEQMEQPELQDDEIVDETAVITAGLSVTGDLDSAGSIDIFGTVTGNVKCRGKLTVSGCVSGDSQASEIFANNAKIDGNVVAKGAVKVGQGTVIVGDVKALSAVIAGAVKGNIDVNGPVIVDSTAIIVGDIKSKTVQINNGATIDGRCSQCYAEVNTAEIFNIGKKKK